MIYAPLFIGLMAMLRELGWGAPSLLFAAMLASAVGAVLYGARELSLVGTGIGVIIGVALLIVLATEVTLLDAALLAAAVAALIGMLVPFPQRCSRHVPGKTLAGLASGAGVGAVLLGLNLATESDFTPFSLLLILMGIGAPLYVGSVHSWILLSRRLHLESRACFLIEGLVMALLAGIGAGSVWLISAPLAGFEDGLWFQTSEALHQDLVPAITGGAVGGALAGFVLEVMRFDWVHDL